MSIADSGATALGDALVEGINDGECVGMSLDFDESIHSLAACTLHNDVNGVVRGTWWLGNDLRIPANSGNDLVLEGCVWNLGWSVIATEE